MIQKMDDTQIPFCPIIRPKFKEFNDFRNFVQGLDRKYKKDYGIVKIVPPKQWVPRMANYKKKLQNLSVNSPIEQNVFGKGGIYECLHIPKKSMTLEQYKAKAMELDSITEGKSVEEVESMFWKNIAFSPPLYGADLVNSLMDEKSKGWNLNKLDSVLSDSLSEETSVKGVNNPYCYVGSWKALFCWHTEDLDLSAINFLHMGKPKFWYGIHHEDRPIIESEARRIFGEHFLACPQFLRHKTTLISPYYLKRKYPKLRIYKMIQEENEFILAFGGCYHTGFNFGYNIAEAVNYATVDWLRQLPLVKSCQCMDKSVRVSVYEVYSNLSKNSKIKKLQQFLNFQEFVYEHAQKQESQEEFEDAKKGVKELWTKKIKKAPKKAPNKIIYKNEEYEIDNWVMCDKCHSWRKINLELMTRVKKGDNFLCKKIGKQCHKRDKIDKRLFTIA